MKKLIPKPNSSFTIIYQPPLWVIKCYSIDHDMISSDLNYATHLAKKQACYFFFTFGLDLYWYDPHAHLLIKWLISNPCNRRFKWLRNSLTVHTHFVNFTSQNFLRYKPLPLPLKEQRSYMYWPPLFSTPQIISPHTIYCERADPIAKNLVDCEFAFLQDVSSIYSHLGACPLSIGGPNASATNGQNAAGLPFSVGQTL